MFELVPSCRICGNPELIEVIDLGNLAYTGYFPSSAIEPENYAPIVLSYCSERDGSCGLLQLSHNYDLEFMFGDSYGYRSGLNSSMVEHLAEIVSGIENLVSLDSQDFIVDIGSNDATTLKLYTSDSVKVGVDPTANRFREFYPEDFIVIPDFFSLEELERCLGDAKAKVITCISMFYDLPNPLIFMKNLASSLHSSGVIFLEQSYLPLMIEKNSYDTICHEHLEYYSLQQIEWMAQAAGLKIFRVSRNETNGGSFQVFLAHVGSDYAIEPSVGEMRAFEEEYFDDKELLFATFASKIINHRMQVRSMLSQLVDSGNKISALGASTKGNVFLQYSNIGTGFVDLVAEVNPYKFGRFTPGTHIPIENEENVLDSKPDYLLVLTWHFRDFYLGSDKFKGTKLIFAFPEVEIVEN